MNNLIIDSLSHSYNDVNDSNLIFRDINLQINLSETFSLTGESGSGKSTFIHLVTGMLQPSLGSITIDNKKISLMKPKLKASNLSIVFQYHSLLENLNVLEKRLLERWRSYNIPEEETKQKVFENDLPNGVNVYKNSILADYNLLN